MSGTPAEVWCADCDQPSTQLLGDVAYCDKHAAIHRYKQTAPSWHYVERQPRAKKGTK